MQCNVMCSAHYRLTEIYLYKYSITRSTLSLYKNIRRRLACILLLWMLCLMCVDVTCFFTHACRTSDALLVIV